MKVLHVTQSLGAGVEHAIRQYVRALPEVDHEILAVERHGERLTGELPAACRFLGSSFSIAPALFHAASSSDVVHLHSSIAGAIGRSLPRRVAEKVVYSPHALAFLAPSSATRRWATEAVERLLIRRAVAYGAVSSHEESALRSLGADPSAIVRIPHAVTVSRALPAAPRTRTVVGVGRIARQKDPQLFSQVVMNARRTEGLADVVWVWVGDGESTAVQSLRDSGVQVTGWLPYGEVQEWLEQAAATLHTASYEGLPISLVESLAVGTPVVAREIPSLADLPLRRFSSISGAVTQLDLLLNGESWTDASALGRNYVQRELTQGKQAEALSRLYSKASK